MEYRYLVLLLSVVAFSEIHSMQDSLAEQQPKAQQTAAPPGAALHSDEIRQNREHVDRARTLDESSILDDIIQDYVPSDGQLAAQPVASAQPPLKRKQSDDISNDALDTLTADLKQVPEAVRTMLVRGVGQAEGDESGSSLSATPGGKNDLVSQPGVPRSASSLEFENTGSLKLVDSNGHGPQSSPASGHSSETIVPKRGNFLYRLFFSAGSAGEKKESANEKKQDTPEQENRVMIEDWVIIPNAKSSYTDKLAYLAHYCQTQGDESADAVAVLCLYCVNFIKKFQAAGNGPVILDQRLAAFNRIVGLLSQRALVWNGMDAVTLFAQLKRLMHSIHTKAVAEAIACKEPGATLVVPAEMIVNLESILQGDHVAEMRIILDVLVDLYAEVTAGNCLTTEQECMCSQLADFIIALDQEFLHLLALEKATVQWLQENKKLLFFFESRVNRLSKAYAQSPDCKFNVLHALLLQKTVLADYYRQAEGATAQPDKMAALSAAVHANLDVASLESVSSSADRATADASILKPSHLALEEPSHPAKDKEEMEDTHVQAKDKGGAAKDKDAMDETRVLRSKIDVATDLWQEDTKKHLVLDRQIRLLLKRMLEYGLADEVTVLDLFKIKDARYIPQVCLTACTMLTKQIEKCKTGVSEYQEVFALWEMSLDLVDSLVRIINDLNTIYTFLERYEISREWVEQLRALASNLILTLIKKNEQHVRTVAGYVDCVLQTPDLHDATLLCHMATNYNKEHDKHGHRLWLALIGKALYLRSEMENIPNAEFVDSFDAQELAGLILNNNELFKRKKKEFHEQIGRRLLHCKHELENVSDALDRLGTHQTELINADILKVIAFQKNKKHLLLWLAKKLCTHDNPEAMRENAQEVVLHLAALGDSLRGAEGEQRIFEQSRRLHKTRAKYEETLADAHKELGILKSEIQRLVNERHDKRGTIDATLEDTPIRNYCDRFSSLADDAEVEAQNGNQQLQAVVEHGSTGDDEIAVQKSNQQLLSAASPLLASTAGSAGTLYGRSEQPASVAVFTLHYMPGGSHNLDTLRDFVLEHYDRDNNQQSEALGYLFYRYGLLMDVAIDSKLVRQQQIENTIQYVEEEIAKCTSVLKETFKDRHIAFNDLKDIGDALYALSYRFPALVSPAVLANYTDPNSLFSYLRCIIA